jgi:hypothetical protein
MSDAWNKWKKSLGDSKPWHLLDADARITDQEIVDKRFSICKGCEYFIKLTTQCTKCGCVMRAKTTLKNAECPVGKWHKEG